MITAASISFFVFLLFFLGIGVLAATRKKDTTEDYLLAGRDINPWMTALSAVATDNSGFMFLGLTGMAYFSGVSAIWLMVGWISGEYVAWRFVHQRFRADSEARGVTTISGFLGHGLKYSRVIGIVAGLITLLFLGLYAAAQLKAGSKALESFEISSNVGAVMGAIIVVIYCFAGGIRASIWTDVAQSVVMLGSILLLVLVAELSPKRGT